MNVRRIQPIKKAGGRLISEPASGLMMFQLQLFCSYKNALDLLKISQILREYIALFSVPLIEKSRFRRCRKALSVGEIDSVLGPAGTVNYHDISRLVKPRNNSHMAVAGVEHQDSRLGFRPWNCGTVAVLCGGSATVSYDIGSSADVVEYPIHEAGAVQAVGPDGPRAGTASRPYPCGRSPAGVPPQDQALAAPEVVNLPDKLGPELFMSMNYY